LAWQGTSPAEYEYRYGVCSRVIKKSIILIPPSGMVPTFNMQLIKKPVKPDISGDLNKNV